MGTQMIDRLLAAKPPWVYVANISDDEFREALDAVQETGGMGVEIDCSIMPNVDQLFEAFAAAAQFPSYFGKNWPAFDECLADLAWLPASSYVFILTNPRRLLDQEPVERATFWRIIAKVAVEWSEPVNLGEWWDRDEIPFHVVLEMPSDVVLRPDEDRVAVGGIEAVLLDRFTGR